MFHDLIVESAPAVKRTLPLLSVAMVVTAPVCPRNCLRQPADSKLQLRAVLSALPVSRMSPGRMLGPSPSVSSSSSADGIKMSGYTPFW